MSLVTQVCFLCILLKSCHSFSLWNTFNMLFVSTMDVRRAQYNVRHYSKHEILLLYTYLLYNYFPLDSVGQYLVTYHNNVTHISSAIAHFFRVTGTHCWHGHVGSGIVNMKTMRLYSILLGFKDTTWYLTRPYVFAQFDFYLWGVSDDSCAMLTGKSAYFSYMQQSQLHINLYWEVIFFSWDGKTLRKVESLIVVLFSAYLDSLSPPSSSGITMILCSYLTDTCNNNLGTNFVSTWPSIDNFIQSFSTW